MPAPYAHTPPLRAGLRSRRCRARFPKRAVSYPLRRGAISQSQCLASTAGPNLRALCAPTSALSVLNSSAHSNSPDRTRLADPIFPSPHKKARQNSPAGHSNPKFPTTPPTPPPRPHSLPPTALPQLPPPASHRSAILRATPPLPASVSSTLSSPAHFSRSPLPTSAETPPPQS